MPLVPIPSFRPDGSRLNVEVHIGTGLPGFTIVGLTDGNVRTVRDRLRAALTNRGFDWPNRQITISIPGATDWHSGWDLPAAVGILAASDQVDASDGREFWGGLGLDGATHPRTINLALGTL